MVLQNRQTTKHTQSQKKIPKTRIQNWNNFKRETKGKGEEKKNEPQEGSSRLGEDAKGNAVTKLFQSLKSR